MALSVASINSGSNGNCYYIGAANEAVLIDAGVSCRDTVSRMRAMNLDINSVKAIFISHEHGDHIKGVEGLVAKYSIPIYITPATLQASRLRIPQSLIRSFSAGEVTDIGALSIKAFSKKHDGIDPHSFVVSNTDVGIGIFTDIGTICSELIAHLQMCDAAFLETNYDDAMLAKGRYPEHLKARISGDFGHLSNLQAATLIAEHAPEKLKQLFLSHLSADNNSPEAALNAFAHLHNNISVTIASRYSHSGVYHVSGENQVAASSYTPQRMVQARLF